MQIQRLRSSLLLLLACAVSGGSGCAPKASTTPLGLGPLALAEQSALAEQVSAEKKADSAARKPAAVEEAPAVAAAPSEPKKDDGDTTDGDKPSDSAGAEPRASGKGTPAFAGLFAGKDVAIYRIAGIPERQELDDKAKIRIESDSPTQLRIALINSADGSDMCKLSAEIQGNSALLAGGQPCFSSEGEGAIHAELTSGTLTLNGDRLSMNAEGTLSVALAEDELEGDLSYSFKGKRQ
ncbi:MAG: hypothetical protein ABI895_39285 [Deltaproteobacteria bacterium]